MANPIRKTKKVIITGGCGFIGHHVVEHFLRKTNWNIIVLDKLSYASFGYERLRSIGAFPNSRVQVFPIDITMPLSLMSTTVYLILVNRFITILTGQ